MQSRNSGIRQHDTQSFQGTVRACSLQEISVYRADALAYNEPSRYQEAVRLSYHPRHAKTLVVGPMEESVGRVLDSRTPLMSREADLADTFTPELRSWTMSRVPSKNTSAELRVRSQTHRKGYRYRLHKRGLPGKPDIVLPRYRTVVFVHGCFWHRHSACPRATMPQSNVPYWQRKFERTLARDALALSSLIEAGWTPLTIWECQTKDSKSLSDLLSDLLPARVDARETGRPVTTHFAGPLLQSECRQGDAIAARS